MGWILKVIGFLKQYKGYAGAGAGAIGGTGLTILFMSTSYTDTALGSHVTAENKRWDSHLKAGDAWKFENKQLNDSRHFMTMDALKTINDNQLEQWKLIGGNVERFKKIKFQKPKPE